MENYYYVATAAQRPLINFKPAMAFGKIPGENEQLKDYKSQHKKRMTEEIGRNPTRKELSRWFPIGIHEKF